MCSAANDFVKQMQWPLAVLIMVPALVQSTSTMLAVLAVRATSSDAPAAQLSVAPMATQRMLE